MAQNALTVTPPNPTPPTNMGFIGATPRNPETFANNVYDNPFNHTAKASGAGGSTLIGDDRTITTTPGVGVNPNPAPYFPADAAGTVLEFNSAHASVAVNGTSVEHEGRGTEVVVTQSYATGVLVPGSAATFQPTGQSPAWAAGAPGGPVRTIGSGPVATQATRDAGPNANHPSYISAAVTPTITGLSAGGTAGAGTTLLTVTGTNFNRASIVNVNGVPQVTNYVSATSLTVTNAPKKATAGNVPVTVTAGVGGVTTAPTNWVFT